MNDVTQISISLEHNGFGHNGIMPLQDMDANKKAMKCLNDYTIILRPDDNGTYVAYIPAIKGCHAWGETPEEAKSELNHVFEMISEEYREEGKNLPDDVEITVSYAS